MRYKKKYITLFTNTDSEGEKNVGVAFKTVKNDY